MKVLTCLFALLILAAPVAAFASPPNLPPRPPRDEEDNGGGGSATIALHLTAADGSQPSNTTLQGLWTVVQWLDGVGNWHDVDGWEGVPAGASSNGAHIAWKVDDSLFGKGPFRWVVEQGSGGAITGASAAFYLPHDPGEIVPVMVTLDGSNPGSTSEIPSVAGPAIALTFHATANAASTANLQNFWTIVQWGDGLGTWYDIARWQGPFDSVSGANARKTWPIEPILLGRGIFRWQVLQGKAGSVVATSETFYLAMTLTDIVSVGASGGN